MTAEFTVCTHCKVNNQPDRAVCWQCGGNLPHQYGLDGVAVGFEREHTCRHEDLDALLDKAVTVDAVSESRRLRMDMLLHHHAPDTVQDEEDHPTRRHGLDLLRNLLKH